MAEMRRETAHAERRGAHRRTGLERRASNWRDATRHVPPDAREALALRSCLDDIRAVLAQDDNGLVLDADRLRMWLDAIDLAVAQCDDTLRASP